MFPGLRHTYQFDSFVIDVEEQVLLRDDQMVPLTPKAFETLLLLVRHQGSIVTKQKILDTLWPDVFVEESNITFNITRLRKALGDTKRGSTYIETVPRRGYRFKAEVKEVLNEGSSKQSEVAATPVIASPAEVPTKSSHKSIETRWASGILFNRKLTLSLLLIVASMVAVIAAARRLNRNSSVHVAATNHGGEIATPNANIHYEQITSYGNAVSAAISPDAKQFAYIQENPGQESIWLVQLATQIRVQVIPPSDLSYRQISFSHDGNYIFFARHDENQPSDLYRIPTLKGPAIKLLDDIDGAFSLSADDHKVVFRRRNRITREDTLYIGDLESRQERTLVTSKGPDWIRAFSLSPDGKKVVFATGETDSSRQTIKISELDVETAQARLLVVPNWYAVRQLEWLPSGDGLLICARESATTNPQFWRMSYPDGALRKLTNDLNNYLCFSLNADASAMIAVESTLASHIWISPNTAANKAKNVADGRGTIVWTTDGRILYNAASQTGTDLWIANSDGTDPKQLSFNAGYNDWPSLSPDHRIVFHSSRTGAQHLFRMDPDGSNLVQLTNGYAERNAAVSPDGKWVYYNSSESSLLWKVPLDGGEPIQLTNEYAAYPSVSPDGKLVACFHFPKYDHEAQITIRSTDDMKVVSELKLAPGLWISRSIRWDADNATVIYANQSQGKVKVYRQSMYSGAPQELTTVKAEDEFEFSFSPDRRQLAYVSTKWNHDVVLIDGFK